MKYAPNSIWLPVATHTPPTDTQIAVRAGPMSGCAMLRRYCDYRGNPVYLWWNNFQQYPYAGNWKEWREVENPERRYDPENTAI